MHPRVSSYTFAAYSPTVVTISSAYVTLYLVFTTYELVTSETVISKLTLKLVGMEGFEPPTNPRCKRGALNQLSYIPNGQDGKIPAASILRPPWTAYTFYRFITIN